LFHSFSLITLTDDVPQPADCYAVVPLCSLHSCKLLHQLTVMPVYNCCAQTSNWPKLGHITPVLQQLHWLPVRQRVEF